MGGRSGVENAAYAMFKRWSVYKSMKGSCELITECLIAGCYDGGKRKGLIPKNGKTKDLLRLTSPFIVIALSR